MNGAFNNAEQIIAFDADNTLWDWVTLKKQEVDFMVTFLADETGLPQDDIRQAVAYVYRNAGTADYSGLVQNIHIFENIHVNKKRDLIKGCKDGCLRIRQTELKLYDGIKNVLQTLKTRQNVAMCIVSDAPMSLLLTRARHTKSWQYFDMLFGQREENDEHVDKILKSAKKENIPFANLPAMKPGISLNTVFEVSPADVRQKTTVIGNSEKADLGLAYRNKCRCLLAGWGASPISVADTITQMLFDQPERKDMPITQHMVEMIKATDITVLNNPEDILDHV